jgi:hypothetical protein
MRGLGTCFRVDEACFSACMCRCFDFIFWFFSFNIPNQYVFLCVYCLALLLSLAGCALDRYPLIAKFDSEALQAAAPPSILHVISLILETAWQLSADVFPSNDEVCVYLLEYVCSRGPLRPILCSALLLPISLAHHSHTSTLHRRRSAPRRGLPAWPLHR